MLLGFLTKYNCKDKFRCCCKCKKYVRIKERLDCIYKGEVMQTYCVACWKEEVFKDEKDETTHNS